MELPQYTLKPSVNRMVAPWILKLLGLAVLFYFGIYFNVKFAMKMDIPSYINILIFVFLVVLVVTQVLLYHIRFGKYSYKFYTNRIEFEGKKPATFLFSEFQQADVKQGVFDKAFGTGIIRLSKSFSVGPITNVRQIESYLEQLVKYYRYTQERFRAQQQQASMQQEMAGQQAQQQYAQQPTQQQPQQSAQGQQQASQPGAQGGQYRGI
ncbi:hypothetical protein KY363_05110 [Candidatus Woesearchaeota archaeon]|nr:hypothetical protein [Candidatus Woesearchaeota archaeon]